MHLTTAFSFILQTLTVKDLTGARQRQAKPGNSMFHTELKTPVRIPLGATPLRNKVYQSDKANAFFYLIFGSDEIRCKVLKVNHNYCSYDILSSRSLYFVFISWCFPASRKHSSDFTGMCPLLGAISLATLIKLSSF